MWVQFLLGWEYFRQDRPQNLLDTNESAEQFVFRKMLLISPVYDEVPFFH